MTSCCLSGKVQASWCGIRGPSHSGLSGPCVRHSVGFPCSAGPQHTFGRPVFFLRVLCLSLSFCWFVILCEAPTQMPLPSRDHLASWSLALILLSAGDCMLLSLLLRTNFHLNSLLPSCTTHTPHPWHSILTDSNYPMFVKWNTQSVWSIRKANKVPFFME